MNVSCGKKVSHKNLTIRKCGGDLKMKLNFRKSLTNATGIFGLVQVIADLDVGHNNYYSLTLQFEYRYLRCL